MKAWLSALILFSAPLALARILCDPSDLIPFVPAAGWPNDWQGFVRINTASYRSPLRDALGGAEERTYVFDAIDDAGNSYRMSVLVKDQAALHFNSHDLEWGNVNKGDLSGTGTAPERGHWRLCFQSTTRARVGAYIRTRDGFLTDVTASLPGMTGFNHAASYSIPEWRVPILNPGRNTDQVSELRIVNNTNRAVSIRIYGQRGDGDINPDRLGVCTLAGCSDRTFVQGWIPEANAVHITSAQLESGTGIPLDMCNPDRSTDCFDTLGALGPSAGKWSVYVALRHYTGTDPRDALVVMNLMRTPAGHVTTLQAPRF